MIAMPNSAIVIISCLITIVAASEMHDGNCPPDAYYFGIVKVECYNDSMCAIDEGCCPVLDTMKCVKTVDYVADVSQFKQGECPYVSDEMAKTAINCRIDQDCPAKNMCCEGKCVSPLPPRPLPHEGFCPMAVRMPIIESTCQYDSDCHEVMKCCHMLERISCVRPVYHANMVRKPGHCPEIVEDEEVNISKLCNGDDDCFGADRCCPTSTTFRCVPPRSRPVPPKRGFCRVSSIPPNKLIPLCRTDYDCIGDKKCCWGSGVMECTYPSDDATFQLKPAHEYEFTSYYNTSFTHERMEHNSMDWLLSRDLTWIPY